MREMRTKHQWLEIEDALYCQNENRIRELGPSITLWRADVAKDIVLAVLELCIKSKSAFKSHLCFEAVNATMHVYKAKNHYRWSLRNNAKQIPYRSERF